MPSVTETLGRRKLISTLPTWREVLGLPGGASFQAIALLVFGALSLGQIVISPRTAECQEPANSDLTEGEGLHELYYGAHLPHDRATIRKLERAEELLQRKRYSEALPILDELLSQEQDVFPELSKVGSELTVGVKEQAAKLLAELPPAGREAYLLLFDATASRHVKAALEEHDLTALENAAARFENTPAGEEAAVILAQLATDRGDFMAASRIIDRLSSVPAARERWGDYLLLRAAELKSRLGDRAAAERFLARSSLRGEAAAEFRHRLAASPSVLREEPGDRNPLAPAGTPHLWERWRARVVVDRRLESQLYNRRGRELDSLASNPLLPSAIAVGDFVVARSLNNLVAIEWKTGKRVWETRPESDAWLDASDEQLASFGEESYSRGRVHPLLLRLWKDAVFASLSSDEQRVYAIRDLDYATPAYSSRWGMLPGFGDSADRKSKLTNRLAAYRMDAEGKIAWEIAGAKSNQALSGAFFLGAPLAYSSSLYVLAEIDSGIYLLKLNPKDGQLLWKQLLVSLERGIDQDTGRRLAGATLSCRNGVLVCPTGAGVVVGVDPSSRALLWAFRVPIRKNLLDQQEDLLQRRAYGSWRAMNDQWLESRAILSAKEVVLTLPESPDLFCLRLSSGELVWKRPREDGIYVAGITDSHAIVVGKREVVAVGLHDGETKWKQPLPDKLAPSGRGLLCGDELCLPLEKGQLAVLKLRDGSQSELLKTHSGLPVGNLLAHRGTILSQSLAHIDRFDRREELQREITDRLATDSADAAALRIAGELAESKGDIGAALDLFKRAQRADSADMLIRERVIDALLAAVKRDFSSHRDDLALLESLADEPLLKIEVLQLKANGLASGGEFQRAFQCLLQVYDLASEHDDVVIETSYGGARIDRWFAGTLNRIWQAGDAATRAMIVDQVNFLRADSQPKQEMKLRDQARFARFFGGLEGQESVLFEVAEAELKAGSRRNAELLWLRLAARGNDRIASKALQQMSRSLEPEKLETLPQSGPMAIDESLSPIRWPAARIAADVDHKRRPRGARGGRADEEDQGYVPIRFQAALLEQIGPPRFAMTANGAELMAWDESGDVLIRTEVGIGRDFGQSRMNSGNSFNGRMGHFVFLSQGDRTFAFDAFAANTRENLRMWVRSEQNWNRGSTRANRAANSPHFEPAEATLLAISPEGIVLHARDAIYCVHPLTGELEWFRRSSLTQPRVICDSESVYVASDDRTGGQVFALADGTEIGSWEPPSGTWIASAGHYLVSEREKKDGLQVDIIDLSTSAVKVHLELPRGTKSNSFAPGRVALLTPAGRLEVIDANAGEIAFSLHTLAEPNLVSLEVFPSDNNLYVLANTLSDADQHLSGYSAPPGLSTMTGKLYALDAFTGEQRWPQPAEVTGRVLLPLQPSASPAILLASFRAATENGNRETAVQLLAIDKATGQSVFRSESLGYSHRDSIVVRLSRRPEVTLELNSRLWEVRLQPSDRVRPPEPVVNDKVESLDTQGKDGLWGVGRQLGRVLDEVFRGGPE